MQSGRAWPAGPLFPQQPCIPVLLGVCVMDRSKREQVELEAEDGGTGEVTM